MNDLRVAVIKLAKEVPELRRHLVPILREAAAGTKPGSQEEQDKMYEKGYRYIIRWSPQSKQKNKDSVYGKTMSFMTGLIREDFPDEKGYKIDPLKPPKKK